MLLHNAARHTVRAPLRHLQSCSRQHQWQLSLVAAYLALLISGSGY